MKKILLICLIVISSNNLWSQNIYVIDSIISIDIPGQDIKIDSLQNKKNKIQFKSKIGNSEFLAEKTLFENDSISNYNPYLPYDLKSLEDFYEILAQHYVKNSKFKLDSEKLIEKNNFKGYHLTLIDKIDNGIYEIEFFFLNKNLYLFSYKNNVEFDLNDNDKYFNSIQIKSSNRISQFLDKSLNKKSVAYNLGFKIGYTAAKNPSYIWISAGLILILIIGTIVYFVRRK